MDQDRRLAAAVEGKRTKDASSSDAVDTEGAREFLRQARLKQRARQLMTIEYA